MNAFCLSSFDQILSHWQSSHPYDTSPINKVSPAKPEKAMAPHSSTLAWKTLRTEEPGRLQSMGSQRVGHNWATSLSRIGEGNGNPLQCSCLENPRDRGASWAAVYGVAQSRTRLKRLRSSSSSSTGDSDAHLSLRMTDTVWSWIYQFLLVVLSVFGLYILKLYFGDMWIRVAVFSWWIETFRKI